MKDNRIRVAIVDYGMGNIKSVMNAFNHVGGAIPNIISEPKNIEEADCFILPGVGAFNDAITNLRNRDLVDSLREQVIEERKPILAICLGMQLVFESSEEGGMCEGLGWMKGNVKRLNLDYRFRIPAPPAYEPFRW